MRKLISIFSVILTALAITASGAPTAKSVLDKAAARINGAKSITADYTITAGNASEKGRLMLASGKFTLSSASLKTWYDGLTLWTYSPSLKEVNITTPTSSEIAEINPFALVNDFQSNFNARLNAGSKTAYSIELTPKKKSYNFVKAIVTVDKTTYYPTSIVLTMKDRSTVKINVESVTAGGLIGNEQFRFDPSQAPGAEIVDLR